MGLSVDDIKGIKVGLGRELGVIPKWEWMKLHCKMYTIDEELIDEQTNDDDYALHDLHVDYDFLWNYDVYYHPNHERIVFPVYINGEVQSAYGKSIGSGPKWMNYNPGYMGGYISNCDTRDANVSPWVLVEDIMSSMAIESDMGVNNMALLGTNLSSSLITQIQALPNLDKGIIICLDEDATAKAVEMKQTLDACMGVQVSVLPLTDDVKDMNSDQRHDLFNQLEVIHG